MRKILLLIFYSLAGGSPVFSQASGDRSTISVSIGAALPTCKFASNEVLNSQSGAAKIGEAIAISFSVPLMKEWSFIAQFQGQRNPLNTHAFETTFSQTEIYQGFSFDTGPGNPPPQSSKIYPNWKFEKSSWSYGALLLGTQRRFSVNKGDRFNLFAKILAGALYAKSPRLMGSSITDTATAHIEQSKSSATGFVYSLGAGFNYNFTKACFITAALAYYGTNQMKFKNVKAFLTTSKGTFGAPDYSVQQSATTGNGQQIISSITLSLGIGIRL